jgi:hypothetical protein
MEYIPTEVIYDMGTTETRVSENTEFGADYSKIKPLLHCTKAIEHVFLSPCTYLCTNPTEKLKTFLRGLSLLIWREL